MQKENWIVEKLGEDGWSVLRRDIFVYLVPRDVLPDDVAEGDVIQSYGATTEDYGGRWSVERKQRAG